MFAGALATNWTSTVGPYLNVWMARFDGPRQLTRWHFVESLIEDRFVTNCGRQMVKRTKRGLLLTGGEPTLDEKCAQCA